VGQRQLGIDRHDLRHDEIARDDAQRPQPKEKRRRTKDGARFEGVIRGIEMSGGRRSDGDADQMQSLEEVDPHLVDGHLAAAEQLKPAFGNYAQSGFVGEPSIGHEPGQHQDQQSEPKPLPPSRHGPTVAQMTAPEFPHAALQANPQSRTNPLAGLKPRDSRARVFQHPDCRERSDNKETLPWPV